MKLYKIFTGDCIAGMSKMPAQSVHTCITSPPYYELRDYGVEGQHGNETLLSSYIEKMVEVFAAVWRVLRDDGTLWLNIGDTYADNSNKKDGLKAKDLMGVPWRVALALQAAGWYLRQDIIWHKPNTMTESCDDRCVKSHEYIFLLTKKPAYFFDFEAIREKTGNEMSWDDYIKLLQNNQSEGNEDWYARPPGRWGGESGGDADSGQVYGKGHKAVTATHPNGRGKRSVWTVPVGSYKGAHFATFPPKLILPCILAGTSKKGACPDCGAPWVREVESIRIPTRSGKSGKGAMKKDQQEARGGFGRSSVFLDPKRHVTATRTIGWQPGCACSATGRVPCTVLDPYLGSGTTVAVAVQYGRRGVGCELNPEYVKLARERIEAAVNNVGFGLLG